MKKLPISTSFLSALALTGLTSLVVLAPSYAQQSGQIRRSGKIEMSIDPTTDDIKQLEASIRRSAQALNLDTTQQGQLDDAISELRKNLQSAKGPFNWKWEYNSDGTPGKSGRNNKSNANEPEPQSAPRGNRLRDRAEQPNPRDLFRQFFGETDPNDPRGGGNPQGLDPRKLMEEMLKQMGVDPSGNGNRQQQFEFKFGPNGLEPKQGQGNGGNRGVNPLENLRGLLGGMGHGHDYDPSTAPHDSKYSRSTLSEYRSCIKDVRGSTVAVLKQGKPVALGAVVSADGHIITKASELGKGALECELMDGKIYNAKIVHTLDQYDLALIKVDAKNLKPVSFKTDDLQVGTMLVAAGIDENPVSVGVLSVPMRNLDDTQKGFVGVGLDDNPNGKGVIIMNVVEGGPAEAAGLEKNDVVLSIDGKAVNRRAELMAMIAEKTPGEIVKLNVSPQQGGDPVDVEVTLSSRAAFQRLLTGGIDPTAQMGSDLSNRTANFPNALQNDLGLNAEQCGGPVVDIDGNVVGLNIARSGRTSTLMLSGKIMKGLLADVSTGKLNLVKDSAAMDKDIKKAEAALKAAEAALKAAQEAKAKASQ